MLAPFFIGHEHPDVTVVPDHVEAASIGLAQSDPRLQYLPQLVGFEGEAQRAATGGSVLGEVDRARAHAFGEPNHLGTVGPVEAGRGEADDRPDELPEVVVHVGAMAVQADGYALNAQLTEPVRRVRLRM